MNAAYHISGHTGSNVLHLVTNDAVVHAKTSQSGKSSEVYPYTVEELRKMISYMDEHNMEIHILALTLSCNIGRRCSDYLGLKWSDVMNPNTGLYRSHLQIQEKKTKKYSSTKINDSCKNAFDRYISKTGCEPAVNYSEYVFLQLSGTHKGKVMSYAGHMKALKKAADAVGIEHNVGTHSGRKTFGSFSAEMHPNDPNRMQTIQAAFGHSSEAVTSRYIGLTQQNIDRYADDIGNAWERCIIGSENIEIDNPVITLDVSDFKSLITAAYTAGKNNNGNDINLAVDAIAEIMATANQIKK